MVTTTWEVKVFWLSDQFAEAFIWMASFFEKRVEI